MSKKDKKRHAKLSWKLIEAKYRYYRGGEKESIYTDSDYDDMEIEYLKLCKKLNKPNTIVHKEYPDIKVEGEGMMEVDDSRPSVQLVIDKVFKKRDYLEKERIKEKNKKGTNNGK